MNIDASDFYLLYYRAVKLNFSPSALHSFSIFQIILHETDLTGKLSPDLPPSEKWWALESEYLVRILGHHSPDGDTRFNPLVSVSSAVKGSVTAPNSHYRAEKWIKHNIAVTVIRIVTDTEQKLSKSEVQ